MEPVKTQDDMAEPVATRSAGTVSTRVILLAVVLIVIAGGVAVAWHYHLGLEQLKGLMATLMAAKDKSPWLFAITFFAAHVVITALCVPVEVLMTLAAGALFGLVEGTILISFASSIGATIAFLGSRFLLRDTVNTYFARALATVDEGMRRDGVVYLLTLRLLPVFPFFLTNIVMGVTSVRIRTFYLISQIGMLAATLLYVNAGTQLAHIQKLSDILSPSLIAALLLLSLFPWVTKLAVGQWRK